MKFYIDLFNLYVKNAREELSTQIETLNDLIMKLFKGYKATAVSNIVEYTEKRENAYLDGKNFEPDKFI